MDNSSAVAGLELAPDVVKFLVAHDRLPLGISVRRTISTKEKQANSPRTLLSRSLLANLHVGRVHSVAAFNTCLLRP